MELSDTHLNIYVKSKLVNPERKHNFSYRNLVKTGSYILIKLSSI